MDLADAKGQLEHILTVGSEAAGGEWEFVFDVQPAPCAFYGSGEPDEPYSYAPIVWGPGFDDPEAVAASVANAWQELGYEVYFDRFRAEPYDFVEVQHPRDATGLGFSLWVSASHSSLDGVSACGINRDPDYEIYPTDDPELYGLGASR